MAEFTDHGMIMANDSIRTSSLKLNDWLMDNGRPNVTKIAFYTKLAMFVDVIQRNIGVGMNNEYLSIVNAGALCEYINTIDHPDDMTEAMYNNCLQQIEYEDGIPCINGYPIWERLEGERMEFYRLFKEYREMKYAFLPTSLPGVGDNLQGVGAFTNPGSEIASPYAPRVAVDENGEEVLVERVLAESRSQSEASNPKGGGPTPFTVSTPGTPRGTRSIRRMRNMNPAFGMRSIGELSLQTEVAGKHLQLLSRIYHWPQRVRAYDAYKAQLVQMDRARNAMLLETKHSVYTNQLVEQAMSYLRDNAQELTPKVALEMVELGIKYGRISAGLVGDKPGGPGKVELHQTNVAINSSTTSNSSEQHLHIGTASVSDEGQPMHSAGSVQQGDVSLVHSKLRKDLQSPGTLLSVLTVLQKSGAMEAALRPKQIERSAEDDDAEIQAEDPYTSDGTVVMEDGSVVMAAAKQVSEEARLAAQYDSPDVEPDLDDVSSDTIVAFVKGQQGGHHVK